MIVSTLDGRTGPVFVSIGLAVLHKTETSTGQADLSEAMIGRSMPRLFSYALSNGAGPHLCSGNVDVDLDHVILHASTSYCGCDEQHTFAMPES